MSARWKDEFDAEHILRIFDECAENYTFTMLDNGYKYPAACRLSLHRSESDWALVLEDFGFSPRVGDPDLTIKTFASRLHARNRPVDYVSEKAYQNYLATNPHNEYRSVYPVDKRVWAEDDSPIVDDDASEVDLWTIRDDVAEVSVRGRLLRLPPASEYLKHGIELEDPPHIKVFELCRYMAAVGRDLVLATPQERRVSLLPEMKQILLLEEWRHPDLAAGERPSEVDAFRQLAQVLATGDPEQYQPTESANTHWSFWPVGGTL
ncbi:DUF7003 family protein [Paludisphaera rhizosphaerae]|uniref:DUF7003 family protein n=1 Tax=Paludisphaera rhizosphaerae TaxID=2711216 RepID=UPI0013EB47D3|nr:hypothetical protein [Paludisphaera rhizosphaerae]